MSTESAKVVAAAVDEDAPTKNAGIVAAPPITTNDTQAEAEDDTPAPVSITLEPEGDDYNADADSTLGSSEQGSSNNSVNAAIRAYRTENGRTYHSYKDGKYYAPNDEQEQDRLDLFHHTFCLSLGGALINCPIPKEKTLHRVLDIGTGTGIWAIDFADGHPESQVLGIDLSPIQPQFVPPNLYFEVDDVEEEWMFSHKFDLIHSRMMIGSITQFPLLFRQAFENLNPGGYIQMVEHCFPVLSDDGTLLPTSYITQWSNHMMEGGAKIGRPLDAAKQYKAQLEAAGFVDVVEVVYKWPVNQWAKDRKNKEIGMYHQENWRMGLSGISLAIFTRVLGWSALELEVLLAGMRREMADTRIHAYNSYYMVHGRKPE